jgi:DNA-binding IclR family transcriptional regulator
MAVSIYRKRFDDKARTVLSLLVEAGTSYEAPAGLIDQACRRALGMTKREAVRSFMETMQACGYIEPGEATGIWRIHPEKLGIPIPERPAPAEGEGLDEKPPE